MNYAFHSNRRSDPHTRGRWDKSLVFLEGQDVGSTHAGTMGTKELVLALNDSRIYARGDDGDIISIDPVQYVGSTHTGTMGS